VTLQLQRGELFHRDFELQALWYLERAGDDIAQRFLDHLNETLDQLMIHPAMGRARRYKHRELKRLRSFRVKPPFNRHLIFYRFDSKTLFAVRLIDGARDLPRRLVEPPGAN
jgi:plasmid stabilization system protein ParE